jgi:hypothetical protein
MSTLRSQAQDAASRTAQDPTERIWLRLGAAAAHDEIYDPLLRPILDALDLLSERYNDGVFDDLINRTRKALG